VGHVRFFGLLLSLKVTWVIIYEQKGRSVFYRLTGKVRLLNTTKLVTLGSLPFRLETAVPTPYWLDAHIGVQLLRCFCCRHILTRRLQVPLIYGLLTSSLPTSLSVCRRLSLPLSVGLHNWRSAALMPKPVLERVPHSVSRLSQLLLL